MKEPIKSPIQPFGEFKEEMQGHMDVIMKPFLDDLPTMGDPEFDAVSRKIFEAGFKAGYLALSKRMTKAITVDDL